MNGSLRWLQLVLLVEKVLISFLFVAAERLAALAVDVIVDVAAEKGTGVDASDAQLLPRGSEHGFERRSDRDGVAIAITRTGITR